MQAIHDHSCRKFNNSNTTIDHAFVMAHAHSTNLVQGTNAHSPMSTLC